MEIGSFSSLDICMYVCIHEYKEKSKHYTGNNLTCGVENQALKSLKWS